MVIMSRLSRAIVGCVAIALVGATGSVLQAAWRQDAPGSYTGPHAATAQAPRSAVGSVAAHRALLDTYCVTCHNARLRTAGLVLSEMDLADVGEDAEHWEKVVRKLRAEAMPPAGRPRPDAASYAALTSWLEAALDRAAPATAPPRRHFAVHRLNRLEYGNAIRDLLGPRDRYRVATTARR